MVWPRRYITEDGRTYPVAKGANIRASWRSDILEEEYTGPQIADEDQEASLLRKRNTKKPIVRAGEGYLFGDCLSATIVKVMGGSSDNMVSVHSWSHNEGSSAFGRGCKELVVRRTITDYTTGAELPLDSGLTKGKFMKAEDGFYFPEVTFMKAGRFECKYSATRHGGQEFDGLKQTKRLVVEVIPNVPDFLEEVDGSALDVRLDEVG